MKLRSSMAIKMFKFAEKASYFGLMTSLALLSAMSGGTTVSLMKQADRFFRRPKPNNTGVSPQNAPMIEMTKL